MAQIKIKPQTQRRKEEEIEKQTMATNQEKQTEAGRHQEVGHKSLLQSDALYQVYTFPNQIEGLS